MDASSSHLLVPPSDARTLVPRALAHLERLLELALGRLTLPVALLARSDGDAQVAWRRRGRIAEDQDQLTKKGGERKSAFALAGGRELAEGHLEEGTSAN